MPYLSVLSPEKATRLRYFDEAASEVNLPSSTRVEWRNVLAERALKDDEVDAFFSEICDTPVHKIRSLSGEITDGRSDLSSLAPPSRRYFERLVGAYDGSTSIQNYAAGPAKKLFGEILKWKPYKGFLLSLFLSSHSSLTAEIDVGQLSSDELVSALKYLTNYGDRLSQMGAIEVGLRVLRSRPEIEPLLVPLIRKIRDDDVDGKESGFKLLSALFILVDGELSRKRLFSAAQPFYRRLAALSQAALIHRQLVNLGIDIDIERFHELALSHRGQQFYAQSLADMRAEPRWDPEFVAASQIKADFCGRLIVAAKNYEQDIKNSEVSDLLLGSKPGSLIALSEFPFPYLPGPLEGAEEAHNVLPTELSQAIDKQLRREQVGPSSFIALVNSALIFKIGVDQAELAAKALKLGSYRLNNLESKSHLLAILNGLATVAAITRSHSLADELRILVRRYRCDAQYLISVREAVKICIVASANRDNMNEWRDFAGDWLTELAFGELKDDEGDVLHSQLQSLCHAVPELWVSCGRADAALLAYNNSGIVE